jgi:hypothetical protein
VRREDFPAPLVSSSGSRVLLRAGAILRRAVLASRTYGRNAVALRAILDPSAFPGGHGRGEEGARRRICFSALSADETELEIL